MEEKKLLELIEQFIAYGKKKLALNEIDALAAKNYLYAEFDIYPSDDVNISFFSEDVNYYVDEFYNALAQLGLSENDISIHLAKIFDYISPRPSIVNETFHKLLDKSNKASEYLYDFGVNNYYIHQKDIQKNIFYNEDIEYSINLSKPEKNNKDIAKLLTAKQTNYPKCMLCEENLGFAGNEKKPSRYNLRFAYLDVNNERWFFQYSPYGYFDHHFILVDQKHEFMEMSPRIINMLISFVDMFPYFTIGSNSDLPRVGGSILNHEHFQGGKHIFPLQKAKDKFVISLSKYKHTKLSYLDFYNSSFKIVSKDKKELLSLASELLFKWRIYRDEEIDIYPFDENNNKQSTITPIISKNKNNEYELYIVLRNNAVNKDYPDGIFHAHKEYFFIKKEGLGLIEELGLFILPARLKRQIEQVKDVLNNKLDEKTYLEKYPDLIDFKMMINDLRNRSDITIESYILDICRKIIINSKIFKDDEKGLSSLNRFINSLDI